MKSTRFHCIVLMIKYISKTMDMMDELFVIRMNKKPFKSLKISIGAVMKNPEMLKFVPDHLKSKTMCKHAVKSYLS